MVFLNKLYGWILSSFLFLKKVFEEFCIKKFSFFNCVPFQIAQQSATHDVDSGQVPPVDTSWMYSHYELSTSIDSKMETYNTPSGNAPLEGFGTPDTNQRQDSSITDGGPGSLVS